MKPFPPAPVVAAGACAALVAGWGCAPRAAEESAALARPELEGVALRNLGGEAVPALPSAEVPARVYVFVRSDCPIANRYSPEIGRIHDEYRARGVETFLVYASPDEDAESVREHLESYSLDVPALFDPGFALTRAVGATITPEAVVLTPGGDMPYRGRIDDRYPEYGVIRPEPTRRDLRLALDAVLAGEEVARPRIEAVGCFLADLQSR